MRCVAGVKRRGRLTWKLVIRKSLYRGQTQVDSRKFRPETAVVPWILSWVPYEEVLLIC